MSRRYNTSKWQKSALSGQYVAVQYNMPLCRYGSIYNYTYIITHLTSRYMICLYSSSISFHVPKVFPLYDSKWLFLQEALQAAMRFNQICWRLKGDFELITSFAAKLSQEMHTEFLLVKNGQYDANTLFPPFQRKKIKYKYQSNSPNCLESAVQWSKQSNIGS